jgi:hypothetical protein
MYRRAEIAFHFLLNFSNSNRQRVTFLSSLCFGIKDEISYVRIAICINVTELKILWKNYRTIGEKWENKIRYLVLAVEEEVEGVELL